MTSIYAQRISYSDSIYQKPWIYNQLDTVMLTATANMISGLTYERSFEVAIDREYIKYKTAQLEAIQNFKSILYTPLGIFYLDIDRRYLYVLYLGVNDCEPYTRYYKIQNMVLISGFANSGYVDTKSLNIEIVKL